MKALSALAAPLGALVPAWGRAAEELAEPNRAALGLLDIVFIGIAAYVLWRVITHLSGRKRQDDDSKTYDVTPEDSDESQSSRDRRSRTAQAAWEYLTGEKGPDLHPEEGHTPDAPGAFNEREFLRGAKMIYGRIRQAWAARDLADLRQFAAPDMMSRFEAWASQKPEREQVAVLLVEARVLDLKRDGKRTEVQVAYDATISDDPKTKEPRKVSEVWTFSRDENLADAMWLLEDMETRQ